MTFNLVEADPVSGVLYAWTGDGFKKCFDTGKIPNFRYALATNIHGTQMEMLVPVEEKMLFHVVDGLRFEYKPGRMDWELLSATAEEGEWYYYQSAVGLLKVLQAEVEDE